MNKKTPLQTVSCQSLRPPAINARKNRCQIGNAVVGLLVFLVGVALVVFAFKLAYEQFSVAPQVAVAGSSKEPLNLNGAVTNITQVVKNVLLLIVMAVIGSIVASAGVKLYSNHHKPSPKSKPQKTPPSDNPNDSE